MTCNRLRTSGRHPDAPSRLPGAPTSTRKRHSAPPSPETALRPAFQHRMERLHPDVPVRQQLLQHAEDALTRALAMGRRRDESRLHLRTQAARVAHLVDSPRLDHVRKEIGAAAVLRILPVQVTAALLELPAHLDQYAVANTRLGTRPVERGPHLGRQAPDRLLQRAVKRRVPPLFFVLVHPSQP